MIAKIYPDGHPDLQEKKDPTHPVRYFDIRKLTPHECYRLMGVPEKRIEVLLARNERNEQIISNSAHYKLAGNSIVTNCLRDIYRQIWFPTDERLHGELDSLFAQECFHLPMPSNHPVRIVTLCSGYDSQCLAAEMLAEGHPDFTFELMAWSEFDPESKRKLEEQPAVVAHNLLFPQWADRNRGDMTKADWSDLADAEIDLLTYSTPCQSISQAGKREGIKRGSGTRSAVLWSTENAVRQMRPKVLLQENVRALINEVNRPDFLEWCRVLEDCGYVNFLPPEFPKPWGKTSEDSHTISGVINAKDMGVPQNRERVYMLSIRADILGDAHYEFPRPMPLDKCIADVLQEEVSSNYFLQPDSVIKFLQKNEEDDKAGILYIHTDHKLDALELYIARHFGIECLERQMKFVETTADIKHWSCHIIRRSMCRYFARRSKKKVFADYEKINEGWNIPYRNVEV